MLSSSSLAEACTAATFKPSAFGTEIISVQANLVTNYSASSPYFLRYVAPTVELRDSTFCNVTISYTHPGQDDEVFVETWLPIENPTWNGRFQAVGGGGWQAGRYDLSYGNMIGALADGFATVTTDAGLGSAELPTSWGLKSPGNINWPLFLNFAADSLIDEAVLGKQIVKNLYGQGPEYSYWNGCSQGGRQGLMLAQRYPTAYDGIAAAAPAIYIPEFLPIIQWPQQIMNELGHYPFSCELDAIRAAAIAACDDLDGLADGVINRNYQCLHTFDPYSLVGQTIKCAQPLNGTEIQISEAAAAVVNASWTGMTTEKGKVTWPGFRADADLTGNDPTTLSGIGIAKTTNCTLAGGCVGDPNSLGTQWLGLFVAKDPDFDYLNLTRAEWDDLVFYGIQQLDSIWGTADPDLSRFRDAGGKMVTFHGLADNIIPPVGTEKYYNEVSALLPDVQDFYRYYEVPGMGHCFGGVSGQPDRLFSQLQAWVENGTVPDETPIQYNVKGETQHRILCPYPQEASLEEGCGDPARTECWSCVDKPQGS